MQKKSTHAQLILNGNCKSRKEKAKEVLDIKEIKPSPDLSILGNNKESSSIGIDDIRTLIKKLHFTPHQNKTKQALILEGQNMTEEAQNALLKTLEEPPGNCQIVITANHAQNIIATIISRCKIIKLKKQEYREEEKKELKDGFRKLLKSPYHQRLKWAEENKELVKDKEHAKRILSIWILTLRELMFQKESGAAPEIEPHIRKGLDLFNLIEKTNVSPQLVLETFLLSLPSNENKS
ncbi:MAG: hypothetical protein U9M98_03880 [Patescibacteria group bacterium]|nr:hypothetical protein [Patescibacteria group bacterium]